LFDAGNFFQILQVEEEESDAEERENKPSEIQFQVSVIAENGVSVEDPEWCVSVYTRIFNDQRAQNLVFSKDYRYYKL
jgi:hypothetical protein